MSQAKTAAPSEVSAAEALKCLSDARYQYEQRYGAKQPLHYVFASKLFPVAMKDYQRAKRGKPYRPTPGKLAEVLKSMKGQLHFGVGDFKGNSRIQLDLERVLSKLLPFRTHDGRLLHVVGPEHKHGGSMDLYFTVREIAEGEPVNELPSEPEDDHGKRVRRLAVLIADWFVDKLLAWSPAAVRGLEQRAKKGGALAVLATFFGFAACAGWVAWEYRHITDGSIRVKLLPGIARTGGNLATAVMVWEDDHASPSDVYVVYKDGKEVADLVASRAWSPAQKAYLWVDHAEMPIGEEHTYRLGKKLLRVKEVDVTTAMDLKPCWKCLMEAVQGRFQNDPRSAPALGDVGRELYGVAGWPVRFGGRLDLKGVPPDPAHVPPVSRVDVDFGERGAHAVLDSNNIIHTYLKPGHYVMRLQPLDARYIAPAPIEVHIAASLSGMPIRVRSVPLLPMVLGSDLPIYVAAIPNEPSVLPLAWWLIAVNADLGGDYLENLTLAVSYGDGSAVEAVKLRDVVTKGRDGEYEVVKDIRHRWSDSERAYDIRIVAYSEEQGTAYYTAAKVVVLKDFTFLSFVPGNVGAGRSPEFWYMSLKENEDYTSARVGQVWSASVDPWLFMFRTKIGAILPGLELYVDYGDGKPVRSPSLSLGPMIFTHPGHSWVRFLLTDAGRHYHYVGETKVDIR